MLKSVKLDLLYNCNNKIKCFICGDGSIILLEVSTCVTIIFEFLTYFQGAILMTFKHILLGKKCHAITGEKNLRPYPSFSTTTNQACNATSYEHALDLEETYLKLWTFKQEWRYHIILLSVVPPTVVTLIMYLQWSPFPPSPICNVNFQKSVVFTLLNFERHMTLRPFEVCNSNWSSQIDSQTCLLKAINCFWYIFMC